MAFDQFARILVDALDVELSGAPTPADGLFDDWALDSLQGFQLIIVIEELAGCLVPPPALPTMLVVSDAYDYYRSLRRT